MSAAIPKAGVMGWPIGHSLSPRLHGYWLKHYKIEGSYEALPVEPAQLEQALRDLPRQGFRGVNLTIPHKETAFRILQAEQWLDGADLTSRFIGAVNTIIVQENGKLKGRNTDSYGFVRNLEENGITSGVTATVLGAGGAARAVVISLLAEMKFSEVRIVNRNIKRAERIAKELGDKVKIFSFDDYQDSFENIELLINATSLGMKGQPPLEISLDALPRSSVVNDLVYAPLETNLLKEAQQRGHKTVDGLGMLLHQARPAFEAFFGKDPEVTEELRKYVLQSSSPLEGEDRKS